MDIIRHRCVGCRFRSRENRPHSSLFDNFPCGHVANGAPGGGGLSNHTPPGYGSRLLVGCRRGKWRRCWPVPNRRLGFGTGQTFGAPRGLRLRLATTGGLGFGVYCNERPKWIPFIKYFCPTKKTTTMGRVMRSETAIILLGSGVNCCWKFIRPSGKVHLDGVLR